MKKIKCLAVFAMLLVMASSALNAQTNDELIKKAKGYEEKKEWVYALATFKEANDIQNYNELKELIKSGVPGNGTFNAFTIHDAWINLIKNFQKFFTEHCPYVLAYRDLTLDKMNYENKTASYMTTIEFQETILYTELRDVITTGIAAYKKQYKDYDLSDDFILFSKTNKQVLHGNEDIEKFNDDAKRILKNEGIAMYFTFFLPWKSKDNGLILLENTYCSAFADDNRDYSYKHGYNMYRVKFAIVDKSGKILVNGPKLSVDSRSYTYTIENISPDIMSMIDNKEVDLKPIALALKYGAAAPFLDQIESEFEYRLYASQGVFVILRTFLEEMDNQTLDTPVPFFESVNLDVREQR